MANTLEVKAMKRSRVMPRTAGTLSTANSTSVLSITKSTRNSDVMHQRPASRAKNRPPWSSRATRNHRRATRRTKFPSGWTSAPWAIANRTPE